MSDYQRQLTNKIEISKSIPDKITAIRNIVISMESILQGKTLDFNTNTWKPKGKALLPDEVIDKCKGIINNYAEEVNLFTGKERDMFEFQWYDSCTRMNSLCLNHQGVRAEHYPQAFKILKDALQNIGDIILTSKGDVKNTLKNYEAPEDTQEEF